MSHFEYEHELELPSVHPESTRPSHENAAPPAARRIYSDGIITIDIVGPAAAVRAESMTILDFAEKEPLYTSDAIDRGEFGALYHPVTGHKLSGLGIKIDPAFRCCVFVERASETLGWGGAGETAREKNLPRIGNGMQHHQSEFPLFHWKYDYKTGARLKK